jgi:hypothetical protein
MIYINESNWKDYFKNGLGESEWVLISIDKELFKDSDRGVELLETISYKHRCVYSEGNGYETGYIKLYKIII